MLKEQSTDMDIIFESLYFAMKHGNNSEQMNALLSNINKTTDQKKITLHRVMTEETEEIVKKAFLTKAFTTGNHHGHIDFIKPILFKPECLRCHTNAKADDIAAVIQLEQKYSDVSIPLRHISIMVFTLLILSTSVLFLTWYFALHRHLIRPIHSLLEQLKRMKGHDDLQHPIRVESKLKELHIIVDAFNKRDQKVYGLYKALETSSKTDGLTGIYNRKMFDEHAKIELTRATRYDMPLTLINIDLNNFKQINDTYGHQTGDHLLIFFTRSVTGLLRESDFFFRTGGDEFMILVTNGNTLSAQNIVVKIQEHFDKHPFAIEDLNYYLQASFGIAEFGTDANTLEALIKISDTRMYEHKTLNKARQS